MISFILLLLLCVIAVVQFLMIMHIVELLLQQRGESVVQVQVVDDD